MTSKEFLFNLTDTVDADSLVDKESLFHFLLNGDGGGEFTVRIADGKLEIEEGLHGDPKCAVTATDENFMKVIRGELKPLNALLFGKVKVSNQGELIKYAKVFGLMK